MSFDAYRFSPDDDMVQLSHQAGLVVRARMLRQPERREKVQQAFLLARKPGMS